jgi:hypothetical protein
MPESDRNFTDSLIALKTQYERSLTEATTKASHLREQLSHVNALLLNHLLPSNGVVPQLAQGAVEVSVIETIAPASAQSVAASPAAEAPVSDRPKPKASPRKAKATAEEALASGKRSTRPLLPAYRGLTRLEAIAQLLQTTPGQDVTTDQVSEGLFGKLSAADHTAERKSLNTQTYQGVVRELWQKGTKTGTFLASASAPSKSAESTKAPATEAQAPATTASKRKSLTLLPAYAELSKGEAIAQVLTAASGEVLHHDTIIQTLYGDLSPEVLKEERIRIKTALLTGVRDGKWQKASVPSSYFIKTTVASPKAKSSGRKSKAQTTKAEAETAIAPLDPPTLTTDSVKKRISLAVLPAFEGMTKLDAIAAVLGQNLGEVLHQDTIIQTLYGDLSPEDLKKERVRMDTCLRNGVKNNKWKKAPVPASYVLEATAAAGAKPKRPGRKPDPTKEPKPKPQPEPVAEVQAAKAQASAKASAAKLKPGRKPAVGKAEASQKTGRSKRTELELVALLRKADIQV